MFLTIMIIETLVTTVLLAIAIVLTIDMFKRIDKIKKIDALLDTAIDIQKKMIKIKTEMEAELYKFKLIKEVENAEKHNEEATKRKVLGIWKTLK